MPGSGPQGVPLMDTAWISLLKEDAFFASTAFEFLDQSEAG